MSLYRLQAGLYLSADTPHELKGWITAVTRVLDDQRRHVKKPSAKASVTSKPCARPRSNMAEVIDAFFKKNYFLLELAEIVNEFIRRGKSTTEQ